MKRSGIPAGSEAFVRVFKLITQWTDSGKHELNGIAIFRKIDRIDQDFMRLFLAETTGELNDKLAVVLRVSRNGNRTECRIDAVADHTAGRFPVDGVFKSIADKLRGVVDAVAFAVGMQPGKAVEQPVRKFGILHENMGSEVFRLAVKTGRNSNAAFFGEPCGFVAERERHDKMNDVCAVDRFIDNMRACA